MQETVLITGASSGIGRELAKVFGKKQYNLVLVSRNEAKLNSLKTELETQENIQVIVIAKDLSKSNTATEIFEKLTKKNIIIDILINNAGFGEYGLFTDTNWQKEEQMIWVNILALTHLTKLFLPGMIARKTGKILNLASTAAFQPGPLMAVYYATKAYVLSFSCAIANELENTGVTVTVLCPGPTASEFQAISGMGQSKIIQGKKLPTSADVAQFGYDVLQHGRTVAIHGFTNKLLTFFAQLMPRKPVTQFVRFLQERPE
ncbi:SDR family oxidoreductase [Lusitaniella coriacea LEGE 07157]|uniref:SDR family oxidoreductase n=1 Tax=Lusitaniella coriacea LEGE 07157 TaxID=945747 RepID=A0A8J7E2B7_9CYAN|nr:SDR family oxidoreductase [Lusitaniella coriacea]MBE9117524.1 SDR family oxidoreductase [Lusitaniella coriacea LEGE 07157]